MRILMLGWEFPPFVAGGLGTACQGLTKALNRLGHEIVFILPKPISPDFRAHVQLKGPESLARVGGDARHDVRDRTVHQRGEAFRERGEGDLEGTEFVGLPASFASPYPGMGPVGQSLAEGLMSLGLPGGGGARTATEIEEIWSGRRVIEDIGPIGGGGDSGTYGQDLFGDAERYAKMVVALARRERFDVIHAHDWLTYPAGLALKAVSGKPLVCHIHATEFDRGGGNANPAVYGIERAGLNGADMVAAVSMLTKNICVEKYGVDPDRVAVVYNGVEQESAQPEREHRIEAGDKIVLFLGRITLQKGPEYFIRAAKRVLEKLENVKFVVAGSGDMAVRMIEEAAALGIGHKVLFTGFLRGRDVERVFQMADLYVMPSVSEPFGIAPLEAMHHGTPVLISKQSGVAEILTHALKVDFWDTDEMANKILAVLRHPPLSRTLKEHGAFEVRRLTWDGAAEKCVQVYHEAALVAGG